MWRKKSAFISLMKEYLMDLLILAMAWGGNYRSQLANSDTLWGEIVPSNTLLSHLQNFRWLGCTFDWISYHFFHYYPFEHTKVSLALFLAMLAVSLLLLQRMFLPLLADAVQTWYGKAGFLAATSLAFVNVLFSEHFYFTESYLVFKSAFFFCTLGCFLWSRHHRGWGSLFLVVSSMFYQVVCADAAILLMTLVFLEEKGRFSRRFVRKETEAVAVPLAAGVLNYATGPFILNWINTAKGWNLEVSKAVEWKPIAQMVREFVHQLMILYESSMGLMIPVFLPLLFSLLMTLAVLFRLIRGKKRNELGAYVLYKIVVFFVMCGLQVLKSTSDITPRIICTFYFMQGMNALIAMWEWAPAAGAEARREPIRKTETDPEGGNRIRKGAALLPVLYLCVQIFFIQVIISNRVLSENLDLLYANAVLDRVESYEAETGTQVTKVTFCNDAHTEPFYPQVHFCVSAVNSRLYGNGTYSLLEIAAQERGRHFDVVYKEQSGIEEKFAGKDWTSFDPDEQIQFDGDLVYVCVF